MLALLSGVLLTLSFPRPAYPVLGWIALTPLLVSLLGWSRGGPAPAGRAFGLGFVTGAAFFGGTVYWTGATVRTFGGLSLPVAVLVAALLVAYLALFPALFAAIVAWLAKGMGLGALLLAPAVWVASEMGRTYFWSGFPWLLLGYSQTTVLPVAQVASLAGVFGLSALVASVGAGLAYGALRHDRRAWLVALVPVALALVASLWGAWRVREEALQHEGRALEVALVQGNVPQDEKWNPLRAGMILDRYLALSSDAARQGASLVIWPESATPFPYEDDEVGGERIRALVRGTGVALLFGSSEVESGTPVRYYNSAYLLESDGRAAEVYRKNHLVPFGEYVPLRSLFFFADALVEGTSDFSPGATAATLPLGDVPISTAICYEVVYPGLIRQSVLRGSQLLTTITNDAWYGFSAAPHQHFLQASLRAIEQGRYLVRAANTGISGIVDPYGRVLASSALFETTVLVGQVRLLSGLTVYGRTGDVLAYACVVVTLAAMFVVWRKR